VRERKVACHGEGEPACPSGMEPRTMNVGGGRGARNLRLRRGKASGAERESAKNMEYSSPEKLGSAGSVNERRPLEYLQGRTIGGGTGKGCRQQGSFFEGDVEGLVGRTVGNPKASCGREASFVKRGKPRARTIISLLG